MTSSEIIASALLRSGFPTDNYFTDPEMLTIINDEMRLVINPLVMKLQEEYFLQDKDYTISSGGSYRLPKRTLGNKIRDVKLFDNGEYVNLQRLFEEDRYKGQQGYYLNRNSLTLSSDLTSGTLRVTYFLTPSRIVLPSSCAQIASIDSATQVTVSALPSSFSLTTAVDLVQSDGQYDLLEIDKTITGIAGTTVTFADLPTDLAVGDYICLAGQSPVPVIPVDLHPVLVQAVLCTCLGSKKDKAYKDEMQKLDKQIFTLSEMLQPRVESGDVFIMGQGLLSRIRSR